MTLKRVSIPSPNYSSRGGSTVTTIVLHTAEGATTYQSLGSYFGNTASQVSSHVGIDDTANTVGEYVTRPGKAWTAANANPWSVQAEMCAFAAWDNATWQSHSGMLANVAQWIAEEAAYFGIPIVGLSNADAQNPNVKGVTQHVNLGSMGGGHTDCGPAFPFAQVLQMAGGKPAPAPTPPPPAPAPPPAGKAPPFPWPSDNYIGPPSPDPKCHSGHYGPPDSTQVATWQRQMIARGWNLGPTGADGDYGSYSQNACRQFQQEKGLAVDGLVGPQTWGATWTAPVT
jgi:Putative peptidoglycan binding domain/N-acetylmuramoyl-L-alanine amidase